MTHASSGQYDGQFVHATLNSSTLTATQTQAPSQWTSQLVGFNVGCFVGFDVGNAEGFEVGDTVGSAVGDKVGSTVGALVGSTVGDFVGCDVGAADGSNVGDELGSDGDLVGDIESSSVGAPD